jgi:hypothetical protein
MQSIITMTTLFSMCWRNKAPPLALCEWNPVLANTAMMYHMIFVRWHSMQWWKISGSIFCKLHEYPKPYPIMESIITMTTLIFNILQKQHPPCLVWVKSSADKPHLVKHLSCHSMKWWILSHHQQWSRKQWLSIHLQKFAKNKVLQTPYRW